MFEDDGQAFDRIERWLGGEGRETVRDLAPVLAILGDRLRELWSVAIVRDDRECQTLIEKMTAAPDVTALCDALLELEDRVKALIAASDRTHARRPAAPQRRFLKL
ncbi:MAG: hypothetical protein ACOH2J_16680 [Allorhizobium sp.]